MEEKKGEERQSVPAWKRKWIASRMTFESILFERELLTQKKEKNYKGLIYFTLIFIFQLFLLWLYFFRNNGILAFQDIERIKLAESYFYSFTHTGLWEMIKTGHISDSFDMPFYYFSFFAVFRYITANYSWAIFIINSLYLLIIMLVVYLLINIRRNYPSALCGVAFLSSMPFIIKLSRHFSPQLATIAFVCLTYYFFIKSEDFEDNRWIFPMSLAVSFGVLTDKLFLLYILPIVPWFGYAISGIFRASMLKGFLPGIVIGLPFYLRLFVQLGFVMMAYGKELLKNKNFNFFWYLSPSINALQIIIFIMGALTLLWMYYSLFMPYEKRKIVGKWFFYSYIAFWLIPFKQENYIYPALIPFAISIAIMTPRLIRKFLIYFILIYSFINQSGLIEEKTFVLKGKELNFIGIDSLPFKKEKIDDIMTLVKENLIGGNFIVSILGRNDYLNSGTLSYMAERYGIKNVKFVNFSGDFLLFPDILIVKGRENFRNLSSTFYNLFREKLSFNNRDITIFEKNIPDNYILKDEKSYRIKEINFGGINFSDVIVHFGELDNTRKVYKNAEIFISYASKDDIDIYGINLETKDLCFILSDNKPVFCGLSGIRIKNLKITDFSLARFIEKKSWILKNVSVEIDRDIEFSGDIKDKTFIIQGDLKSEKDFLIFSVKRFYFNGLEFPQFLYRFLAFRLDLKDLPVNLKIEEIRFKKATLEIS